MYTWLAAALALCFACFRTPPDVSNSLPAAIVDWASIVLAALPYVVTGALAASLSRRLVDRHSRKSHGVVALIAILNPGCDCALNGFARALIPAPPALAGFALTFAAAASPASLAVTYTAFGMRMTAARVAGALVAAALTSAAWHGVRSRKRSFEAASYSSPVGEKSCKNDDVRDLAQALGGVAFAAATAIAAKALLPAGTFAHLAPASAALLGALLSPCSTADPVLAVSLFRDVRAQLVFMLAAQCLDMRQLQLLFRHFGVARAVTAAVCAACACALAALFA